MIRRALFLFFVFISALYANKVIYCNYDEVPQRVIKGQIFSVTLKTLPVINDYDDIAYTFSNYNGLKILNDVPYRTKNGKYFNDKFYMQATQNYAKLPDIEAALVASTEYNTTRIQGQKLNVIALNPNEKFSNIIADELALNNYKTTRYDNRNNIVIFSATAKNSDIESIHFNGVKKQGIESITPSYDESKVTYYVVLSKELELFTFNYFNLPKNKFVKIQIPIIVDDDSVATQSDLKPKDQSHEKIKMYIALGIAFVGFIFIIIRKKYIYLILIILPLGYTLYIAMPQKEICVKAGSAIHLLPVSNGTIFKTTDQQRIYLKEGSTKNYIKIRLDNDKIGWVKNENTCSN